MSERNDEAILHSVGDNAKQALRSFIERIERLEGEICGLNDDKRDIYKEAKSAGFDPKIIRRVILVRQRGRDEHAEQAALIDLYLDSLDPPRRTRDDEGNDCPGVAV